MSVYVDSNSRLHHDQEHSLALMCPHCQVFTHITAVSVPQFAELIASRPNHVGVVYRCDSCSAPIFLKFAVKMYAANRVELANNFVELERAREKFNFTYLPENIERLFREALGCYSGGYFNAFASMSRRTAQAVFQDLGENGRLRIFEQINEARDMAEIDPETFGVVKKVHFRWRPRPEPGLAGPRLLRSRRAARSAERPAVPGVRPQGQTAAGDDGAAVLRRRDARQDHADRPRRDADQVVRRSRCEAATLYAADPAQSTQRRALRNIRIQPPVLAPLLGMPRVLHGAEHALRMRHQDRQCDRRPS